MKSLSVALILYFSICFGLQTQSTIVDSLAVKGLIEKAESVADTNIIAALEILKEAKEFSNSSNLPLWKARVLYSENYYYSFLLNHEGIIKN